MRKLKHIIKLENEVMGGEYGTQLLLPTAILALDENGELWHGTLETTDDSRRVINWTPVNTPKDGAAYSEPQLDFFDKWEREANERIQADIETSGETVPLASNEQDHASATGEEAEDSSDKRVEDGEGSDPAE